jgi:hypothetical protein
MAATSDPQSARDAARGSFFRSPERLTAVTAARASLQPWFRGTVVARAGERTLDKEAQMWGLFCSRCHRLLYRREMGPINPRAVLPQVGTMLPDGTLLPESHRMGYCPYCMADTYCREITDEDLRDEDRKNGTR